MSEKIAKALLIVFKPAIIPLIALIIVFNSDTYLSLYPLSFQIRLYIIIFVSTFLLPITLIPLLFGMSVLDTIKIETKKDNIIFLFILSIANTFTFIIIKQIPVYLDNFISFIFIITAIITLLAVVLTYFGKTCYHLLSLGSLTGFIVALSILFSKDFYYFVITVLIFSGIIGFAKIRLNKNSQLQIYSAFLIGFFISMTALFLI